MIWRKEDIVKLEKRYRAAFINSINGFKSANLIGTRGIEVNTNLSIVSSLIHLGSNPALLGLVFRPDSVERHTLENIRSTGFFTANHVHAELIDRAHQTSANYPKDVSEFDACGIKLEYIENFFAPFVKESKIKIGLQFEEEHKLMNDTVLVVGSVHLVEFPDNALLQDGFLDIEFAETAAISGLDSYHTTKSLRRLSYATTDKDPVVIQSAPSA